MEGHIPSFIETERAENLVLAWRRRLIRAEAELASARRTAAASETRLTHQRRGDRRADLAAECEAARERVVHLERLAAALAGKEADAIVAYRALTGVTDTQSKIKPKHNKPA